MEQKQNYSGLSGLVKGQTQMPPLLLWFTQCRMMGKNCDLIPHEILLHIYFTAETEVLTDEPKDTKKCM